MRALSRPLYAALLVTVLAVGTWAQVAPSTAAPAATAAAGPAVPILLYHHVTTAPKRGGKPALYVNAALFRQQVAALADAGYEGVTLDQVWSTWHGGDPLPAHPIVFSFDDGYASAYRTALPVLRARGWTGVLNLIVHNRYPEPISTTQVRGLLSAGWELDGHSLTHPDLTKIGRAQLIAEVGDSRSQLMARYGVPVNFMAYPYGHVNAQVAQVVREAGYLGATTTKGGLASPTTDPERLPRVIVGPHTSGPSLVAKLATLTPAR
jgi:peptidoglycan/xylan/chitin deacetylase (PgdA/CDA1 family)